MSRIKKALDREAVSLECVTVIKIHIAKVDILYTEVLKVISYRAAALE